MQTRVAKWGIKWLSGKLETVVSAKSVSIDVKNHITLHDFYVEDWDCDTLLFVRKLQLDIGRFELLKRAIRIDNIRLDEPTFQLRKNALDESMNIDYLIKHLSGYAPKDTTQKTKSTSPFPIDLELGYLHLQKPRFVLDDRKAGTELLVQLDKLNLNVKNVNFDRQQLNLDSLVLTSPLVLLKTNQVEKEEEEEKTDEYLAYMEWLNQQVISLDLIGWDIHSDRFIFTDGFFSLDTGLEPQEFKKNALNVKKLRVSDIQMDFDDALYAGDTISGRLNHMQAMEQSGLTVKEFYGDVEVSSTHIGLRNMLLRTNKSELKDRFALRYNTFRDFKDFVNKVSLNVNLDESRFTFDDIAYFAPDLSKSKYIARQRARPIQLSGKVSNTISRIRGKEVELRLGRTHFKGDFRIKGLPDVANLSINVRVDALHTDMSEVRSLLPDVVIPPQYDKLGNLHFEGWFRGFTDNFVAFGDLRTDIGRAKSDIQVVTDRGIPSYSGDLKLYNFKLGEFINDPHNFGQLSFDLKLKGRGLQLKDLHADVKGTVNEISVKNYTYTNVAVDGKMDKKRFTGMLEVNNDDVQLDFKGVVDLNGEMPEYEFIADVNKIHLQKLNLVDASKMPEDLILSGNTILNLKGNSIDNIEGNADVYDFHFSRGGKTFDIDTLLVSSYFANNSRSVNIVSDVLNADINGKFNFAELPNAFKHYLHQYFPFRFADAPNTKTQQLDFDIDINNPIPVTQVFLPQLKSLPQGKITGKFDSGAKALQLDIDVPTTDIEGTQIHTFTLKAHSDWHSLDFNAHVDSVTIGGKTPLPELGLAGKVYDDTLAFHFALAPDTSKNRARVNGLVFTNIDTLKMQLDSTELVLNDKKWQAYTGAFTYKNKDYFVVENIVLRQDKQSIVLNSRPSRNHKNYTQIEVRNILVSDFSHIKAIRNLGLKGILNGEVVVKDVFDKQVIVAELDVNDFEFKSQEIGHAKVGLNKQKHSPDLGIYVNIENDDYKITGDGFYRIPNEQTPELLDIEANLKDASLTFLEAFIGEFVSDTEGTVTGKLRIHGNPNRPNFSGRLLVEEGATTIDFLQTRYHFSRQFIDFKENVIKANNIVIQDKHNNTAQVNASLFLNDLKNLSIDARLDSDNFLFLDTKAKDNESFYGTAYGNGFVTFRGYFDRLQIGINARSNPGTLIYLPVNYETETGENTFYQFINTGVSDSLIVKKKKDDIFGLKGMTVNFNLDITPDAEIQIIFDQQAGDIIKGTGKGDIQMVISTIGDFLFDIRGNYRISKGTYRFTLQNIINKDFSIEEGGTVHFSGDPFAAILNVNAIYKLKASLFDLLSPDEAAAFSDDEVQNLKRRLPVDVLLKLSGQLYKPDIDFEIRTGGDISGRGKELIRSKLNELRLADVNELNKQVFGLLVLNRFISPESLAGGNDFLKSGVSTTVSELLSTYLSSYLNDAISGLIPDSELSFNWRNYTAEDIIFDPDSDIGSRNEIELIFTKYLLDNRLSIDIGGNFDVGSRLPGQEDNIFGAGDFVVEYKITPDGKYKLKVFNRYDYDIYVGRYNKAGAAVSISQDFDSFKDLFKRKKKRKKKKGEMVPASPLPEVVPNKE